MPSHFCNGLLPLSTQVYAGGNPAMDKHPIQGGVVVLLVSSCNWKPEIHACQMGHLAHMQTLPIVRWPYEQDGLEVGFPCICRLTLSLSISIHRDSLLSLPHLHRHTAEQNWETGSSVQGKPHSSSVHGAWCKISSRKSYLDWNNH